MVIELYLSCDDNEKYSENGINLTLHATADDDEVAISFEDDGGKTLFSAMLSKEQFKKAALKL